LAHAIGQKLKAGTNLYLFQLFVDFAAPGQRDKKATHLRNLAHAASLALFMNTRYG